jgi:uncharacterized protein YqjF (DUF2071 family)
VLSGSVAIEKRGSGTRHRDIYRQAGARWQWLWSLDALRAAAVVGARVGYGRPYAWSQMRVTTADRQICYESRRRWPDQAAMTRIDVERGIRLRPANLEDFLTALFRLYSFIGGRLT